MLTTSLETPLGLTIIEGDENGVARISVTGKGPEGNISGILNDSDKVDLPPSEVPPELQEAVLQLREYFYGSRTQL